MDKIFPETMAPAVIVAPPDSGTACIIRAVTICPGCTDFAEKLWLSLTGKIVPLGTCEVLAGGLPALAGAALGWAASEHAKSPAHNKTAKTGIFRNGRADMSSLLFG